MKPMRRQQPTEYRAFTMIEMLVTLAITIVLMLFVGQIFSQISSAAKSGIAISHIIENARVITGQISDDAANMVGPSDGGFLIVATAKTAGALLDEDDSSTRAYFADQITWVRLRGDLEPVVPGLDNTFSNSADAATHVRVYYGHGIKANPANGSAGAAFGSAGPNEYASQWILARHALFLSGASPPSGNHANSSSYSATVSGVASGYWTGFTGPKTIQGGVSDVAAYTLDDINAGSVGAVTTGFGSGTTTRLIVNPAPATGDFECWEVAQASSILATGVSDFIVEYATLPASASSPIVWTRTDDTVVKFTQADASAWPDLIRIRFRLHGTNGSLAGADGEPGVVYERILRVKK